MADALKWAMFRSEDGLLVPQEAARSLWNPDQMWGMGPSGAMARELERTVIAAGRDDLRGARFTVDMSKAASMDPCHVDATVVRESGRLMMVEASLSQRDTVVTRASAVFLKRTENPSGEIWTNPDVPHPPPLDVAPVAEEIQVLMIHSDPAGWSIRFEEHQNQARKTTWQTSLPVVSGETNTPFVNLAFAVDATNITTNMGNEGMQFINTDISVAVARLPVSFEIGLSTVSWYAEDGIGVGSATVFDREGPIGTSTVTCLNFARRALDFTGTEFNVD